MNIVFFYSGSRIPGYQIKNLLNIHDRFPGIDLHFITDNKPVIKYLKNIGIKTFFFNSSELNLIKLTKYNANNKLLNSAIVRFFGAQQLIKDIQKPVILVESDVWLANNFPFETFESINCEMAYPVLYKGSAIASTVYIRDEKSINNFINYIEKSLITDPTLTDMQILWRYMSEYKSRVLVLPTSINNQTAFNFINEPEINSKISANINIFNGLFDGATWGQFITGEDPKNLLGIQRIYHSLEHHSINPRNFHISTKGNGNINVAIGTYTLPLYSLHIHSKDQKYFLKLQNKVIHKRIVEITNTEKYEFHLLKGLQGIRKESIINFINFIKNRLFRLFY